MSKNDDLKIISRLTTSRLIKGLQTIDDDPNDEFTFKNVKEFILSYQYELEKLIEVDDIDEMLSKL